ncbi:MAG: 4Fe-4S binding protein [Candidatus Fermentibacteraceae bacterium]
MIEIKIDEDACVGCQLCVDECPTDVFEFDEEKAIPVVEHDKECFGCLSCSEICPSDAIEHRGVERSEDHYHEPYTLELASRLAPNVPLPHVPDDPERRKAALEDLGVRLLSVASVFRHTLGGSLPAVGTMAGRTLATQLPRYQVPKDFQEALDLAVRQFAPAWELSPSYDGAEKLEIDVGTCFIRELCGEEGIELGGDLCVLFYNYLAGYIGRMGGARLKLEESQPGDSGCRCRVKVFRRG